MRNKKINAVTENLILFCIGGISYIIIEMLWRGYSHWSMFFLGGACFLVVGRINEHAGYDAPIIFEMVLAASIITTLEFVAGYILNIRLHMGIWDYSDMPGNIMGQVCVPYMILWFFLSFFCIVIDDKLRLRLFGEK